MAAPSKEKPMPHASKNICWDRGNLAEWRAALPEERRRKDEEKLSRIFNLAAKVPELKDALDWARDHGIEFIVDHQAKAGGYYWVGSGVVAIVNSSFDDDAYATGVIVHETRHAWQDYYGMIPTVGKTMTDYFTRLSLIEADATAHQSLASEQYNISHWLDQERERNGLSVASLEKWLKDGDQNQYNLWRGFQTWYGDKALYYWRHSVKLFGSRLGIPGVHMHDLGAEYQPYAGRPLPRTEGIDITRPEQVRRLGKGFNGKNYFNVAANDAFAREYLSPARAEVCYREQKASGKPRRPSRIVNEIRRRQLRLKHHRGFSPLI